MQALLHLRYKIYSERTPQVSKIILTMPTSPDHWSWLSKKELSMLLHQRFSNSFIKVEQIQYFFIQHINQKPPCLQFIFTLQSAYALNIPIWSRNDCFSPISCLISCYWLDREFLKLLQAQIFFQPPSPWFFTLEQIWLAGCSFPLAAVQTAGMGPMAMLVH